MPITIKRKGSQSLCQTKAPFLVCQILYIKTVTGPGLKFIHPKSETSVVWGCEEDSSHLGRNFCDRFLLLNRADVWKPLRYLKCHNIPFKYLGPDPQVHQSCACCTESVCECGRAYMAFCHSSHHLLNPVSVPSPSWRSLRTALVSVSNTAPQGAILPAHDSQSTVCSGHGSSLSSAMWGRRQEKEGKTWLHRFYGTPL